MPITIVWKEYFYLVLLSINFLYITKNIKTFTLTRFNNKKKTMQIDGCIPANQESNMRNWTPDIKNTSNTWVHYLHVKISGLSLASVNSSSSTKL